MKASIAVLSCHFFLLLSGRVVAQNRPPPIIDVHLHANPADAQGPPPARICAPADHWPTRDAAWSSEQYAADLNRRVHCSATLVSVVAQDVSADGGLEGRAWAADAAGSGGRAPGLAPRALPRSARRRPRSLSPIPLSHHDSQGICDGRVGTRRS